MQMFSAQAKGKKIIKLKLMRTAGFEPARHRIEALRMVSHGKCAAWMILKRELSLVLRAVCIASGPGTCADSCTTISHSFAFLNGNSEKLKFSFGVVIVYAYTAQGVIHLVPPPPPLPNTNFV